MVHRASQSDFLDRLLDKIKILVQESLSPHCFDAISSIMRKMHSNAHVMKLQDQVTTALPFPPPPSLFSGHLFQPEPETEVVVDPIEDWRQAVTPPPMHGGRRVRNGRR